MAKKKFSFTIGMQFTIEDLKDEMNQQFINLYSNYYLNQNFNQEEFINKSLVFFNENKNNFEAHDSFFNNFTILTEHFLKEGKLFEVEKIWRFSLDIAYQWEQSNPGERIHKGSPYHFLGVTYLLFKDYMSGFLLIHQALEEDKKTQNKDHPYTPGYYFVILNYDKSVYGQELLKNIADYLNLKILEYKKDRSGSLTIDEFKKKFLEQEKNIDIVFSFVYLLFNLNKLETGIRREFIKNDFASLFEVGLILDLCLIIDSVIKAKDLKTCFNEHFDFLCKKRLLSVGSNKAANEVNKQFNKTPEQALRSLLEENFFFSDNTKPTMADGDFLITYGLRNYSAHNIESRKIIYERFFEIVQRILNTLFFTVEKVI
jgi:hypothetical protein